MQLGSRNKLQAIVSVSPMPDDLISSVHRLSIKTVNTKFLVPCRERLNCAVSNWQTHNPVHTGYNVGVYYVKRNI